MSDANKPLMNSFVDDILYILLDDEKTKMFTERDIVGVKAVMADYYSNNQNVLERISENELLRLKFGSTKLLSNIIQDIFNRSKEEIKPEYLIDRIRVINSFEDAFFNNIIYSNSLKLLLELVKTLNSAYTQLTVGNEEVKNLMKHLFSVLNVFNNKVIRNVNLNNNSNTSDFRNLYNQIRTLFSAANYKFAEIYFGYFYTFSSNLKDNTINPNDIKNNINQFLNSQPAAKVKEVVEKTTRLEEFFETVTYKDTIFNRSKNQQGFIQLFFEYFNESKKQELIHHWIPLNGNIDFSIFERILETIEYKIPEPDRFANKLLAHARNSNNLEEKERLYNLIFKLNLPEDYKFSTFSQQMINNLCSVDLSIHNLALNQINKHRSYINEFDLNQKSEDAFINTFLPNIHQYSSQINNLLIDKIGVNKKRINDEIRDKPNVRGGVVSYFASSGDLALFNSLRPILFKNNYVLIAKEFLNNSASLVYSNKSLINKYQGILEALMSKYFNELKVEMRNFIDQYNHNNNQEKDNIIFKLEDKLNS